MAVSSDWLYTLLCVLIRLGMIIFFAPIQALKQLPMPVKIILTFMISLLLTPYIPEMNSSGNAQFFTTALTECFNGLILLLGIQASFSIFLIAGQLIDSQMGLNAMAIFNPIEHTQEPFTGRFLSLLAICIMFAGNYHHLIFRAFRYSFIINPPGHSGFTNFLALSQQFSAMFLFSLLLAAPIITGLLAIDLSAALLTRNMPQVNTWFLVLPLKILSGIVFLNLTLKGIHPVINHIFQTYGGTAA